MFVAPQFPWYLFDDDDDDTSKHKMTKNEVNKLHNKISAELRNMNDKQAKAFIDKVNKLFKNAHGDDWVEFKLDNKNKSL